MDTKKIKTAVTKFAVHDLIRGRFSPRAFADEEITKDVLNTILEAATWAPSAMNEQPWRYIAALKQNKVGFEKLSELLLPGNAVWAPKAAALVFCYTKLTYSLNGNHNGAALHDTGMSNQNLLLQAVSMNIYAHVMGGFDKEKSKQIFNLDNDSQPICIIALGYLGDSETLAESFKAREHQSRSRKSLEEVVQYL